MKLELPLVFPPFWLDPLNEQLWRGEELIPVRPKPFAVLRYLVEHAGRLVSKEELRKAVWQHAFISEGVLKGYIRDLREALGDEPGAPRFIETVARRGYRFVASVRQAGPGQLSSAAASCVGREQELGQLQDHLARALRGHRQVVFVTGEPGIGKTTVVETFLRHVEAAGQCWLARGQCVELYGPGEAYLPVLEALGRLGRVAGREPIMDILRQYAPTWLVQLPALLAEAEYEALQRKVQGTTRERMLREMAEVLDLLSARRGLLLVLEDLHWSDPSTLDLLAYVAQRREAARLLIIGTYRPAEVIVSGHPLRAVKQDLQGRGLGEELALGMLPQAAVSQYLAARFPQHQFPNALSQFLYRSAEGNPLFLVNIADYLVVQGLVAEADGHWQLKTDLKTLTLGIPESLRQLIERQIERLPTAEQRMLEAASMAGAEFSGAAVAAGLREEGERVDEWCEDLVRRGRFLRSCGTELLSGGAITGRYSFLHALYQQVLAERVPATRRIRLHRLIGERIELDYGERASEVAAELALHFERGHHYARAVQYRQHAGQHALQRGAPHEAIAHFSTGLELLTALPATPDRRQQELTLQLALGPPLSATKGWAAPETGRTYARARELCQQAEDTAEVFPALFGLWVFHYTRAELATAHELAEQLLHIAQRDHEPLLLMEAHHALGNTLHRLGELTAARAHLEQSLALYDPQRHHILAMQYGMDDGVAGLGYSAWVLWSLGYADQAVQKSKELLHLTQDLPHPLSRAWAYNSAAWQYQFLREAQNAQAWAETGIALCAEQGFAQLLAVSTIVQGWAMAAQGQAEAGIERMREGLTASQDTGTAIGYPRYLAMLAEAYGAVHQAETGLSLLTEALAVLGQTGERFYEAELYRLKGQLTLQAQTRRKQVAGKSQTSQNKSKIPSTQHPTPSTHAEAEAEACFQQAIAIARRQSAKTPELRAVVSLSRLWQQQGKSAEARQMLAETYGWFTEGFDTPDLQEAHVLLGELS